jgi:hypothetical protein
MSSSGDDEEATLSLSFVDCISCGLAAAIFLFVLFSVEVGASGAAAGSRGMSLPTLTRGEMAREPIDLEVRLDHEIDLPTTAGADVSVSGWMFGRSDSDRVLAAERSDAPLGGTGAAKGFLRRLDTGFAPRPGRLSSLRETGLQLVADKPPSGWILVHRSSGTAAFRFECAVGQGRRTYMVIGRIDRGHLTPESECDVRPS